MKRVLHLILLATVLLATGWSAGPALAAPGAPVQLGADGGSGWRPVNGFTIRWLNPEERGTGIVEARFRVLSFSDGSEISTGSRTLSGDTSFGPLAVPARGAFTIEVRLKDSSGSVGPPASTVVRFDDGRPGDVVPESPSGWLSADEFPYEQRVAPAAPGGPSGVAGYALTVSGDPEETPCPSGTCPPGQISFCLLHTSPSPRDGLLSRMPSSA